jgi:uncharacterized membrane protein YbaN (DUF454 family)
MFHRSEPKQENTVVNNSRLQKSEEARRQARATALEAKERENAMLQERAAMLAVETRKIKNLRALRLTREAAAKVDTSPKSGKAPSTRAA